MDYLLVASGLVFLYFGAEWLLRGTVSLSRRLDIPTLLVSLVVIGFGTSLPELLVSLRAAFAASPGLVLGNVVGSNIANTLLIIGVGSVIFPVREWDGAVRRDALVMLAATMLMLLLVQFTEVGRFAGLVMVTLLALYLHQGYRKARRDPSTRIVETIEGEELPWSRIAILIAASLLALFAGAELLVRGATKLATDFGVSEAVIGLTVVAVGTSLPELATAVVAASRRQSDVTVGNVVGSNIFNILFILGVTALVLPVPVAPRFPRFDVPVMLAAAVLFTAAILLDRPVGRLFGVLLLALYGGYLAFVT